MLTLKEMLETALRNQPLVLREDQRRGAPLCYCTKEGLFVIRYPDGAVETFLKPCLPEQKAAHA